MNTRVLRALRSGSSRVQRVVLTAVVLSAAAVGMIAVLQTRADHGRRAEARLSALDGMLSQRIIAPLALLDEPHQTAARQISQLNRAIWKSFQRLRTQDDISALAAVGRDLHDTVSAADASFALISKLTTQRGRTAMASVLTRRPTGFNKDLGSVERTYPRLGRALARAQRQYDSQAERARSQATIGSAIAIGVLLLAFICAYRRSTRARIVAERLAKENERLAAQNEHVALTDALTGLGNRRALLQALDRGSTPADADPIALALFDLNGFKRYNDAFGHLAGDALLRRLGQRLNAALPPEAAAYRMGGDEFCVLTRLESHDAISVGASGAAALSDHGEDFAISASYGIVFAPAEANTAEDLLDIADQRMYAHKAATRQSSATQPPISGLDLVLAEPQAGPAARGSAVAALAVATAKRLGMSPFAVRQVELAACVHDIGKCAISETILAKPGPLDELEWEFMRHHTIIGERIVRAAPAISHAAPLIRSSHERVDGAGYPDGLRGEQIPLGSRIIAIADAFTAMTTNRPHRPSMTAEAALAELTRCAGTQFDAVILTEFNQVASKQRPTAPSSRT